MKSVLGLLLIVLAALFGSRLIERGGHRPEAVSRFLASGAAYLVLGWLLGPSVFAVIDADVLDRLSPVVTIGLFWIGFLFGLHLRWRDLRKFPPGIYAAAFGSAVVVFIGVGLVSAYALARFRPDWTAAATTQAAVALAACAAGTHPSTLIRLSWDRRFRGASARLATIMATLDDVPGILIAGVTMAVWPEGHGAATHAPLASRLLLTVSLGGLGGFVVRDLQNRAENDQVRLLVLAGSMAVGGGLAVYLHLSPILIGAIAGAAFTNLGVRDEKMFDLVHASESTLYVLLLVVVGAMTHLGGFIVVFAAGYVALRAAMKVVGPVLYRPKRGYGHGRLTRALGLAMLAQGGMAIALAAQYEAQSTNAQAWVVPAVVVIAVFVNDAIAYPLALRVAGREASKIAAAPVAATAKDATP